MPQLVKGGKYAFGWSVINKNGQILIPEEATYEYHIELGERAILMSGSNTSGGFSIVRKSVLKQSNLSSVLTRNPEPAGFLSNAGNLSLLVRVVQVSV